MGGKNFLSNNTFYSEADSFYPINNTISQEIKKGVDEYKSYVPLFMFH